MSGRILTALLFVALAGGTWAWDGAANPAAAPATTSGPLLGPADSGRAMIHADGLVPGAKRTGSLTIANEGADSRLKLRTRVRDVEGPKGGKLSDELLVEIRQAHGRDGGRPLWTGTLIDGQVVAELWLRAGGTVTLSVTVHLPRDASDDIQGAASAFELGWAR